MIGSEGVTRAIVRRLRADLPARLAELRTRYQADVDQLPAVKLIEPDEFDVLSVDQYPAIFVVPVDTTGRLDNRQLEATGAFDEYSFTYNMQVYIYARGDDFKSTSLQTKRYTLAVREVLLAHKTLLDGVENLAVEPRSLREAYSKLASVPDSSKFIGGAYIDVQIVSEERVSSLTQTGVEVTIEHDEAVTVKHEELPHWNQDV
ncbi:hypothetical protein SEA_EASTWEST_14 [Arthrobacter phage EastWest]|uniref:Uncharacterized protein n=1 Tax=Arthrobacter phage EastWest TaxID=2894292 RepID=A0AAE8YK56_9CAUD|nr:hypothetical protein SEA_EASTWEST_14 [Arthrobacter phage EastWest]